MYRVSELLSKPLITLSDAKYAGTVSNIFFDKALRRGSCLELLSEDDAAPERTAIDLKYVKLGPDAAVVPHSVLLEPVKTSGLTSNPINCAAYNQDGKRLGRVSDVLLDGTNIVSVEVDGKPYEVATLIAHSDKLLILNDSGRSFKPYRPARKPTLPPEPPVEPPPATTPPESVVVLPEKLTAAPPVDRGEYAFLLDKKTTKHLLSPEGTLLVPAGTVVTHEVIDRVRSAGKLVQLALSVV